MRPQFHGQENGIRLFRNFKNTVFDINQPIILKDLLFGFDEKKHLALFVFVHRKEKGLVIN
jgi:hypothetical protein